MEFITINHSLNQTYHVEYAAIEATVKKAISGLRGYKLESFDIKSSSIDNNFNLYLEVTFPANTSYAMGAQKVTNTVNEYVSNLIDGKPKNIEIKINR